MPRRPNTKPHSPAPDAPYAVYPFTSIVGQDELKLALLLNVIAPSLGGVLIMGERGTGKSTAVRALADLLPPLKRVRSCVYNCDPADLRNLCVDCRALWQTDGKLRHERARVPVVELPLGATEDRVCGTINLERALADGQKVFETGLLARANRGFLYIDEVNLLEDHLVDILLDASATGQNKVEREGISTVHPARFVLVGSGNPEEGELRPQLLDRFGLYTEVRSVSDIEERIRIVERREAFERDPHAFLAAAEHEQARLRRRLWRAQKVVASVEIPRPLVRLMAELCLRLKVEGHRGELTMARAARALAAFEGRRVANASDVERVAAMSLRHRLRRDPLEQTSGGSRIERALEELRDTGAQDEESNDMPDNSARSAKREQRSGSDGGSETGETSRPRTAASHSADVTSTNETRGAGEHGRRTTSVEETSAPTVDATLPEEALASSRRTEKARAASSKTTRGGSGARHSFEASSGRYARAVSTRTAAAKVAVDATLRVAAPLQLSRRRAAPPSSSRAFYLKAGDLRFKQLRRKAGTLFILAVDTSGSMAVNRISQAKGALAYLLRRSYIKRDRVALIAFREREARLLLPPSQSPARAKRILDALPVGGATPLAAALLRALEVTERAARSREPQRIRLLVFTDGRANVPLAANEFEESAIRRRRIRPELEQLGGALQRAGVSSVVVDTQNRFTSGGEARLVADALGGRHVHLPLLKADDAIAEALFVS